MEVARRIRWANLGRVVAVIAAVGVVVAVGPGLLERPKPPPLATNIGLRGSAEPSKSSERARFLPHTETKLARERGRPSKDPKPHRSAPPHRSHKRRRHDQG